MWVKIRTTSDERQGWQAKAKTSGQSLSAFLRAALDGGAKGRPRRRVSTDPALLRQLALIGNNLNQLARWANRDKAAVPAQAVIARLIEIDRELAALRIAVEAGGDAD